MSCSTPSEVTGWLSCASWPHASVDELAHSMQQQDYDDLEAISMMNPAETDKFLSFFHEADRKQAEKLIDVLKQVGIDVYRRQLSDFRRLVSLESTHSSLAHSANVAKQHRASQFNHANLAKFQQDSLAKGADNNNHDDDDDDNEEKEKEDDSDDDSTTATTTTNSTPTDDSAAKSPDATLTPSSSSSSSPSTTTPSTTTTATTTSAPTSSASTTGTTHTPSYRLSIANPPPSSPAASTMASVAAATASNNTSTAPANNNNNNNSANTQKFSVATWEDTIQCQAYVQSVVSYMRLVGDDMDESDFRHSLLSPHDPLYASSVHYLRLSTFLSTLRAGEMFKKYKRGACTKRKIWCTPALDYVCWGDDAGVKGFLHTSSIQAINIGFEKNANRFYVVSPERTLELEAKDVTMANEWKEMFEALIELNMAELEHKSHLFVSASYRTRFLATKQTFISLLSSGDAFKKWPAQNKIGSFTTRLVWTPNKVDRIQWGDLSTKKVMGFILMQDVVQVEADAMSKTKFSIKAAKRSLDLEAKSSSIRDQWIKALRFFIEFKMKVL